MIATVASAASVGAGAVLRLARAGGGEIFSGGGSSGGSGGGFGGGGGSHYVPIPTGGGGTYASSAGSAIVWIIGGALLVGFLVVGFVSASRFRSKRPDAFVPNPSGPPRGVQAGTLSGTLAGSGVGSPSDGSPFSAAGGGGGPAAPSTSEIDSGIAAIRAHDPAFDQDGFTEGAERSFFTVQQAWCEQKPEMSRAVMADGVWSQHSAQIAEYRRENKRNVLDGLAIARATIVSAASAAGRDKITVQFVAGCADYDVDDKGKIIRGDRIARQWSENWLFERSSSATTRHDGGTMSSKCPNCGAPLDVDLQGTCQYCKTMVMNGDLDWVLARIDQVEVPAVL